MDPNPVGIDFDVVKYLVILVVFGGRDLWKKFGANGGGMSIDIMRSSFGVDEDDNLVVETVVFDAKIAEKEAVVHLQLVRFLRGRQVLGLAALELFDFAAVGGGANMFLGFSVLGDAGFLVQGFFGREFFVLILGVDHLFILAWSGASDKFRGRGTGPFDENDREDAARIGLDDFFSHTVSLASVA